MPSTPLVDEIDPLNCGNVDCDICGENRPQLDSEYFAALRAERLRQARVAERAAARRRREADRLRDINVADDEDVKRGVTVDCPCEACKFKKGEPSDIRRGVIHQYSYRPSILNFNRTPDDPYGYFLGVELETDNHNDEMDSAYAADMARPKRLWFPKHDGSVSGPEFVSHPSTLTYWRRNRAKLQEMFEGLLHAGYSSHNGGHCGMHVNISRTAFESADHIYRFLTLLTHSKEWALTMSQRTHRQMESWARMEDYDTDEKRRRIANASFGGSNGLGHATLFGTPSDGGRFEFRLPRGTLNINRFFMKLEWTVAMIEYTRSTKAKAKMTPKKFMEWVLTEKATDFPDLVSYINEKFGVAEVENATA